MQVPNCPQCGNEYIEKVADQQWVCHDCLNYFDVPVIVTAESYVSVIKSIPANIHTISLPGALT